MPPSDQVRLRHIIDAARQAMAFLENRHRNDLGTDEMLGLALVRLLEVIGEAARGVSIRLRQEHPEIAWSKMAGMRDRLIHGYFDIDFDIVWTTVQEDLPRLVKQIENLLVP